MTRIQPEVFTEHLHYFIPSDDIRPTVLVERLRFQEFHEISPALFLPSAPVRVLHLCQPALWSSQGRGTIGEQSDKFEKDLGLMLLLTHTQPCT